MILDLRDVDFEPWLQSIFDHPVPPTRNANEWYWQDDLEILVDPTRQIELLTDMCSEAERLLKLFTLEQIDQGLSFIFSAGEEYFSRHLWNTNVAWPVRQACILAIPKLWPKLFEQVDVGTVSYMLWDSLAYD